MCKVNKQKKVILSHPLHGIRKYVNLMWRLRLIYFYRIDWITRAAVYSGMATDVNIRKPLHLTSLLRIKMAASQAESSIAINIFGYTVDILQELGRGGFGTVYKGFDASKSPVAVKKVAINSPDDHDKKEAIAEAVKFHFLKENVSHDHVIKVYDVKRWTDSMWIMMDFCDLGDLNRFFAKFYEKIDTNVKLNIMGQIAKGVAFLHRENIVHRDIKPANILVKSSNGYAVVKLGDFGLSKILDPDDMTSAMSSNVGTVTFEAPEFWDRKPNDRVRYNRNVDVYAAGLTFAAMLQAKPGCKLVPKAEGSLEPSETRMSIGLAAFTRCQNKHSEIRVVAEEHNDTPLVKEIKSIVEAMTYFLPEARFAAEDVAERTDSLAIKVLEQWRKCEILELNLV